MHNLLPVDFVPFPVRYVGFNVMLLAMAKHEVELQVSHAIPVSNKDVVIPVKVDDKPLGRLKISRGGVDWLPSPNHKKSFSLTWEKLADLMAEHGNPKDQ